MKEVKAVGLITFGGQQASQAGMVEIFHETLNDLLRFVGHIFVVDDGMGLLADLANNPRVTFKSLTKSSGKAGAVREALEMIVNAGLPADTIILMTDYDRDVVISSAAEPLLAAVRGGTDVTVGNRHALHPENYYRGAVNLIQTSIGNLFGFEGIMDAVSGTWAFKLWFAKEFLSLSLSKGWGLNAEMFVIAGLLRTRVVSVSLPETRNRAESTDRKKLLDNLDGMLVQANALREQGFGQLVDFLSDIWQKLFERQERFTVDLSVLGQNKVLVAVLSPDSDQYTLEGP